MSSMLKENNRGLTLTIEFTAATLRSLIDGRSADDPVVVESAIWARRELSEFIARNCPHREIDCPDGCRFMVQEGAGAD